MRSLALAAVLLAAATTAGIAQAAPTKPDAQAPAPPPIPPKVFLDEGYSQPDITPGMCENVGPKETKCVIPGMTAGDYLILASGASTATAAGAVQAIDIRLGNAVCNKAQSKNTGEGSKPWLTGTSQTIRAACAIKILSDRELTIITTYADDHATADPKGPRLSLRRLPWSPVMSAEPAGADTEQPKAE
jgi:hypothetical protein